MSQGGRPAPRNKGKRRVDSPSDEDEEHHRALAWQSPHPTPSARTEAGDVIHDMVRLGVISGMNKTRPEIVALALAVHRNDEHVAGLSHARRMTLYGLNPNDRMLGLGLDLAWMLDYYVSDAGKRATLRYRGPYHGERADKQQKGERRHVNDPPSIRTLAAFGNLMPCPPCPRVIPPATMMPCKRERARANAPMAARAVTASQADRLLPAIGRQVRRVAAPQRAV